MWHDQSSLIDVQQNDQPELQITLQEVQTNKIKKKQKILKKLICKKRKQLNI